MSHSAAPSKWWLYFLLVVAGITWGMTFSLARIATSAGIHPVGLAFSQAFVGALVLLLVCAFRGRWPGWRGIDVWRYSLIALLGSALPGTLYFYAARHVPAGLLSITVAVVPILTYAIALVIRIDSLRPGRAFGLVCGFAGMYMLARPETLPDPAMLPWILVAMACTICYAAENIYVDARIPASEDMVMLLTGGLIVASVMMFPVMFVFDTSFAVNFPLDKIDGVVLLLGIVSSVAYLVFLYLVQKAGAVFASMMAYVITLAGVGWGMLLFGESHSPTVWFVLLLMILGMFLVTPLSKSLSPVILKND